MLENLELNRLQNKDDGHQSHQRIIKIPVLYGNDYGPDLEEVAEHNQLSEKRSCTNTYSATVSHIHARALCSAFHI